jgi:hypothetical protein
MLHKLTKNLTRHLTRCQLILKIDCEAKGLLFTMLCGDQKWKAYDQICMACSSNKHFKSSKIITFLCVWKMWDNKTYIGKAQCIINPKKTF